MQWELFDIHEVTQMHEAGHVALTASRVLVLSAPLRVLRFQSVGSPLCVSGAPQRFAARPRPSLLISNDEARARARTLDHDTGGAQERSGCAGWRRPSHRRSDGNEVERSKGAHTARR